MTTLLTGSKLPIARHCKWWLRPEVRYPERPRSKDAEDGVSRHTFLAELVETGEHAPAPPSIEAYLRHARDFWKGRVGWKSEVTYGLDAARGEARVVGQNLERAYPEPRTPGEIFLTVDAVGENAELVTVSDWKTGFLQVEPPDENLQLLAGGAAAFLVGQKQGAVLEILRLSESGCFPTHYVASPLVLYRALSEIAFIQAGIDGSQAKAGEHCRWCPALGACPETGPLLSSVAPSAKVQWSTDFVSEDNDRMLVEELSAIKKMIDAIEDALKLRVKERGGIHLSDGKIYKAVVCERSGLSKKKVEEILGPRYAECLEISTYEQFRRVKS